MVHGRGGETQRTDEEYNGPGDKSEACGEVREAGAEETFHRPS
jgi:hypothetical protein